jgi:hypothetical protein
VSDQREPTKRTRDATPAGDAPRASAPEPETSPVPNTTPVSDASGDSPRNAIGAYLLDALPDDERAAFEAYLATSPEAQEELRQLAPVVSLLPQLLDLEQPGDETAPAPTTALRCRILSEAEAEGPVTAEPAPMPAETDAAGEPMEDLAGAAAEFAEESADATSEAEGAAPGRPRTIRTAAPDSGVLEQQQQRRAGKSTTPRSMPEPLRALRQFPTSWLAAAGLAVVAVGAVIWALALLGQIDNKEREIDAQRTRLDGQEAEIADLRSNANATAFTLSATTDGAEDAQGTLLFSLQDQIGVLYVRNLPPLDEDRVYQLWYVDNDAAAPRPGDTFAVDPNGNGFIAVESNTPSFDAIALTEEPEGGSEAPTTPIVLAGQLGGAAG